jgi:hypothetical protein
MTTSRLQQLADLAPQLAAVAKESAAYWSPDQPPSTVLAGELAQALALNVGRISPQQLKAAFDLCEDALAAGSEEERATFATGFLEGLQHEDGYGRFDFRVVANLLGPLSKAHCVAMDQSYGVQTPGL